MGRDYSVLHAADLVAMLPRGARVWAAKNPDARMTDELLFLNAIEFRLRCIEYGLGGCKGRKPKPLYQPKGKHRGEVAMEVGKVADYLSLPRK